MDKLNGLKPEKVFRFFEDICAIPHGSGDMRKISDWCVKFANERGLRVIKDTACNVIIFKNGTLGYENASPVILQGHLDMVCQKTLDCNIDFEQEGLDLAVNGDFISANKTTLGADNGIGSAIILALLDSNDIPHPPIEAVFTADEETGMLGAVALDTSVLKGKTMINLDSEDLDIVTVSCAGGQDITVELSLCRNDCEGEPVEIILDGMQGGHSGVEINKNRINAAVLLGRVLNHIMFKNDFNLIEIIGGDKGNAITKRASAKIIAHNPQKIKAELDEYLNTVKAELSACEPSFTYSLNVGEKGTYSVINDDKTDRIVSFLANCPQGVIQMSSEIDGLVETSQNLGVAISTDNLFKAVVSQRSSRASALVWLREKLYSLVGLIGASASVSGIYPPWEYLANSKTRDLWCECCKEVVGISPRVEAIHAGLECGVFSSAIEGLDCISVGPELFDIHTPDERVSISSVEKLWKILLSVLAKLD